LTSALAVLAAAAALAASAQGAVGPLAQVNAALQAGEADRAMALLQSLPAPFAGEAEAHNLACRVQMSLEAWNAAAGECETAVRLDGQSSSYHLWLGRALGERASRASFLSAYSLAKRVRAEFEQAVQLNPRNAEALAALAQFYVEAPAVVGGGIDKAVATAAQLDRIDPARAHVLRGRIAEKLKDDVTAEREFKQAIVVSPHPASQWVALAGFYRRRQRWNEMETAIHSCVTAAERDQHAGGAIFDGASILIETRRDPVLAAKLMKDYLAGSAKTEEAPAFVAYLRLARLQDQLGDPAAAKQDREAALALAHAYRPS
jgi:tetratricopeptide (TPR) repeat protein